MGRILFLIADATGAHNDNHERLPAAFRNAAWTVSVEPHDALRLSRTQVLVRDTPLATFDLIWVVGLGRALTFFDRMQLLRRVPQHRFVTSIDALMYLHAKYAWSEYMPETHAGNDIAWLGEVLAQGGEWVVKPTAGSYGRDVARIRDDRAGRAMLARLTAGEARRYCLLQRYVPEIEQGEKRTLVAGNAIIGSYLRLPGADFRTNLALEGQAVATQLTPAERRLVSDIQQELVARGIGYAAIDIAFPYLMEVNLANPGGLATLADVYGIDPGPAVVAAIGAACRLQDD